MASLGSLPSLPIPSSYTSSRALAYLSELTDDAAIAIKGLVKGTGSSKYLDNGEDNNALIRTLLDSTREGERIEGLTRVVGLITKGRQTTQFLPLVLKLSSSQSLRIRSLVYIILTRLAPSSPDVSLLSINSFQRDLNDSAPLVRGMALRALTALRSQNTVELIKMALEKGCRDQSNYVRKISAIALGKCYELDSSQLPELIPLLSALLSDRSPTVLGATMATFSTLPLPSTSNSSATSNSISWDLLHPHFRKFCHALLDIDEWGQVSTLEVLLRYARANLRRPELGDQSKPMDKDLTLLLNKSKALLTSKNLAVITTVLKIFYHLTPRGHDYHSLILKPLLRSLHSNPSEQYFLLKMADSMLDEEPELFSREIESGNEILSKFLIKFGDPKWNLEMKLTLSVKICEMRWNSLVEDGKSKLDLKTQGTMLREVEKEIKVTLEELRNTVNHQSIEISCFAVSSMGELFKKLNFGSEADGDSNQDANLGEGRNQPLFTKRKGVQIKLNDLILRALLGLLDIPKGFKSSSKEKEDGKERDMEMRGKVKERALKVIRGLVQVREKQERENSSINARSEDNTGKIIASLSTLLFGLATSTTSTSTSATSSKDTGLKPKKKLLGKGSIMDGDSRASIYWMLGQYCRLSVQINIKPSMTNPTNKDQKMTKTIAEVIAPDVLRRSVLNFSKETDSSKLEILTFSTKLFTFLPTILDTSGENKKRIEGIQSLHSYLVQLARFDVSYEIRDRARFCSGLGIGLVPDFKPAGEENRNGDGENGDAAVESLEIQDSSVVKGLDEPTDTMGVRLRREQVLVVLFEGKPLPISTSKESETSSSIESSDNLPSHSPLGSLSSNLGNKLLPGWENSSLPQWCPIDKLPPSTVRDPPSHLLTPADSKSNFSASLAANTGRSFSSETRTPTSSSNENGKQKVVLIPNERSASPSCGTSSPRFGGPAMAGVSKYKDLDSFLDESEEEVESSEDESEEMNEESEEGEGEDEEDDDDDEEEEEEEEESGSGTEAEVEEDGDETTQGDVPVAPAILPPQNEWA